MKSLISLELRKQRKSFLGLLLIIAISLTLISTSVSTFGELPTGESFSLIAIMFQLFGISFFGLLLGASAGAALRSSERKAEEDIPVRPTKRILAAYIASLLYLIILRTILFVVCALNSEFLQESYKFHLLMVAVLPLHSAAFVFSYWLSQGLLGSVFSVIATAISAFWICPKDKLLLGSLESILAIIFMPLWFIPTGEEIIAGLLVAVPPVIATIVHLVFLAWIVNRTEREKKTWMPAKIVIAIPALGSLSLSVWGMFSLGIEYDQIFVPHCH
jgi:hypothetical protein